MIFTVTLNPAIDKTAIVDDFVLGGVNQLKGCIVDAGGKGINVSKTLRVLNKPNMACGFIGGSSGEQIRQEIQKKMIMSDFVTVQGETRCNLKVNSVFGMTEFNEPGPMIQPTELAQLLVKLEQHAKPNHLFILSGSIPVGIPDDIYKQLTEMLHRKGCRVFLDTNGDLLRKGLEAQPEYIKPNLKELLALYHQQNDFESTEALIAWVKEKALELHRNGAKLVAVSLGELGAVFTDGIETVHAPAKEVPVLSPVGAGDAMTAAIAYGVDSGMHFRDIVRYAMAVSAGACMTEGTKPPTKEDILKLLRQVEPF